MAGKRVLVSFHLALGASGNVSEWRSEPTSCPLQPSLSSQCGSESGLPCEASLVTLHPGEILMAPCGFPFQLLWDVPSPWSVPCPFELNCKLAVSPTRTGCDVLLSTQGRGRLGQHLPQDPEFPTLGLHPPPLPRTPPREPQPGLG